MLGERKGSERRESLEQSGYALSLMAPYPGGFPFSLPWLSEGQISPMLYVLLVYSSTTRSPRQRVIQASSFVAFVLVYSRRR